HYDNDPIYNIPYGKLYNGYVIMDPRGMCPTGWHIPTLDDAQTLINYAGGYSYAAGELKTEGTSYWNSPNMGATNSYGFSALGAGQREFNGPFGNSTINETILNATIFYLYDPLNSEPVIRFT